jgi:hypothetical protein
MIKTVWLILDKDMIAVGLAWSEDDAKKTASSWLKKASYIEVQYNTDEAKSGQTSTNY